MRTIGGRRSWTAAAALLLGMVVMFAFPLAAAPAGAAAGYPPTTVPATAPNQVCNATVTVGANGVGTASCTGCNFRPGTTASFTYGNSFTGTVPINAAGCFTVSIVSTDPCQPDLRMSVNGGPSLAVALRSTTITVSGEGADGAALVDTVYVFFPDANCVVSVVHPATPSTAFTGADIVGMVMGGLVLLAIGALVVLFTRMRSAHRRL